MPVLTRTPKALRIAWIAAAAAALAGCQDPQRETSTASQPSLETAADSLAMRIVTAAGGLAAMDSLRALRFDFVVVRDSVEVSRNLHLWDRRANRHRLEWSAGDSLLVATFDTEGAADGMPRNGRVYLAGAALDSAASAPRLDEAYQRFINDMYWMLAPLKVFDPGVARAVAADSADAETEVLTLSFADVGLTPGDRYWLRADRDTGRIVAWSFVLQSGRTGSHWWTDPWTLSTPVGTLSLPSRKTSRTSTSAIVTPAATARIDPALFENPRPRLTPLR